MTAPVDVGTTRSFSELMAELARSGTPIELPSGSFQPNAIAPLDANENDVLRIVNGEVVWGANVIGFDLARGTTDRITIEKSNDGLAIINIASTYIGQNSIKIVGNLNVLTVQGDVTLFTGDLNVVLGKLDVADRVTGTGGLTVSGSTSAIGVDSDASTNVRIGGLLFTVFPATTFLDSILVTGPTSGTVAIGLDADTIPANLNFNKRMSVVTLTGGRITGNFDGTQRTVIELQHKFTLFGWNPMVALLGITSQGVLRVEGDSGNQSIFLISRAAQVPLVSIRHSNAIGDAITLGANVADLAFWAGDPDLSSITKQVANIKVVGSGFVSPTSGEISGVMEFHIAKADTDTVGPGGNVVKMLPSGMEVLTGTDLKSDVSHTRVMQWSTGFTDYDIQPTGFNKHQTDGPMIYVAGGGSAEFPDRTLVILAQVFGGAKPIVIAAGFPSQGVYEQIKIDYVTPVIQTITMSPHILDVVGKVIIRGVTVLGDVPLPLPGNVTVIAAGATGGTTWGYRVTAHNEFGETLATTEVTISNGNAVLDGTNFNRIQWDHIVGASSYSIYRTTAGGTPATTGQIATGITLILAKRGQHDDKADAASGAVPTVSTAISRIDAKSLLVTAASTVDNAGLRLLPGVAPTSPVDGDMWTTSASAFVRINGVTKDMLSTAGGSHVIADTTGLGVDHTTSGLTAGQVLRATGATTAAFQVLIAADIPNLDTAKITTGTFADARIAVGNVTQHQASIDHDALLNFLTTEHFLQSAITVVGIITAGTWQGTQVANAFIADLPASKTTSGTFVDARIAASNVTQHEAALTILETQITDGTLLARLAANETVSGQWTFSDIVVLTATTAARASTRAPHGTVPTTPVNGDIWTTTAGLFVRVNGSTVGPLIDSAGAPQGDITAVNITAGVGLTGSVNTASGDHVQTLDISGYVGETSITILGTIATGVWQGTTIAVAFGGTGVVSPTSGNLLVGAGASAMTLLAPGAAAGFVRSNGTAWVRAAIAAADVASGTFANARIAVGNVTQHEAALTILESQITNAAILARIADNETISGQWTFSDIAIFTASTTARASIRLPHDSAPTTPVNGDMWTTTVSAFIRINGTTVDIGVGGGTGDITRVDITAGTGLTGSVNTLSGDHIQTISISGYVGETSIVTLGTITTGTWQGTAVAAGFVGVLDAAKITTGTFADARIPNLNASKITAGTFANARIAVGNVTQHQASINHDALTNFLTAEHFVQSAITVVGTLTSGAIPASLVTTGAFGAGNYEFPANIVFINSSANAKMTIGLTIQQGTASDEGFAMKSNIAHGMTLRAETDTYFSIKENDSTGGALLQCFSTTDEAIDIHAMVTTETATRSVSAVAPMQIIARLKSGTDALAMSADKNMLVVRNLNSTRFILDSDGDSHQDVGTAWTNFDKYDDPALLTRLSVAVSKRNDPIRQAFGEVLQRHRDELERLRIVTFNNDGHHFVNMSRMSMLMVGAIRQLAERQHELERRFERLLLAS